MKYISQWRTASTLIWIQKHLGTLLSTHNSSWDFLRDLFFLFSSSASQFSGIEGEEEPSSSQGATYKVGMLGASGVGKTALTAQFTTSDYICAYDASLGEFNKKCPFILYFPSQISFIILLIEEEVNINRSLFSMINDTAKLNPLIFCWLHFFSIPADNARNI